MNLKITPRARGVLRSNSEFMNKIGVTYLIMPPYHNLFFSIFCLGRGFYRGGTRGGRKKESSPYIFNYVLLKKYCFIYFYL